MFTTRFAGRTPRAFTLIELLIVVAIIAILAAIAVPNFLEAQTRSKVSRARSDMRTLATGLEAYYVDNNTYPQSNGFAVPVNSTAPGVGGTENWPVLEQLSTPIAYVTNSIVPDAFFALRRTGSVYNGSTTGPGSPGQPGLSGAGASGYADNPDNPFYRTYQFQSMVNIPYTDGSFQDVRYRPRRSAFATGAGGQKGSSYVLLSAGPDSIYINMGGVLGNNSASNDTRTPEQKREYCANLIYDPTNGTISFGDIYRVGGQTNSDGAKFFLEMAGNSGR